jgi:SNF2 family DNA or RNA helicase
VRKTVTLYSSERYGLSFSQCGEFEKLLAIVKSISDSRYDWKSHIWSIPITKENTDYLLKDHWLFLGDAYDVLHGNIHPVVIPGCPPVVPMANEAFPSEFRSYQKVGVRMLLGLKGRGLLADPMGLGKTPQAILYMKLGQDVFPTLIVCPASLKVHWQRELKKWAGLSSYICSGRTINAPEFGTQVWIINYEILPYWETTLADIPWKLVIADECQRLANKREVDINGRTTGAQSTSVFIRLAKRVPQFIPISGTPLRNCSRELYVILNLLDPKHFHNEWAYKQRYCGASRTQFGIEFKGATHTDELYNILSHYMIRRERSVVLPELPKKQRIIVPLTLDNEKQYTKDEILLQSAIEARQLKEINDRLVTLQRTGFAAKQRALFEWLDSWLEENPDEKIILVAYHRASLDALQLRYKKIAVRIDGQVLSEKRQGLVDRFQEDKGIRVMLAQMTAAGVGFSMTAASTVAFTELWYVPGDVEQMEDRVNRITQEADHILAYYLLGCNTIEEQIMEAVEAKNYYITGVLDGKGESFFGEGSLFDRIAKKRKYLIF